MNYFTIEELSQSSTAIKEKIDNIPTVLAVRYMNRLIEKTLNPAREILGTPIKVNSGFRSLKLNSRIGGARNSYHLQGRAADLNAGSPKANIQLYNILQRLPHIELINEKNATWIHVAL
ncbi:MAG: D-Ala-D-Ala carboxypeptidase family metallohydrolase [Muribaculaceae bacterium]